MTAYYNENDPGAAAWLRELIRRGLIAPGDVDDRSILDVRPADLAGYSQCHFFAGVGIWSYALRLAGWPDDRPAWTGSCPCQPFSVAGKGEAYADARHLAPAFLGLVAERRPPAVFGEQVASPSGRVWLADLRAEMEALGYVLGAADLCSAGVGAPFEGSQFGEWLRRAVDDCPDPLAADALRGFAEWAGAEIVDGGWHVRQRLYFGAVRLAEPHGRERDGRSSGVAGDERDGAAPGRLEGERDAPGRGAAGGLGDAASRDARDGRSLGGGEHGREPGDGRAGVGAGGPERGAQAPDAGPRPGARNRLGRDADWLLCRDAGWRPVRPGAFPLADAAPARVGRLRGYGNGLDGEVAAEFIEAFDAVSGMEWEATG